MTRLLMTGNSAAAWGARLADVDYVPAFPITPQTEIIETLADWIERGEMPAKLTMLESEHSMMTAAGAAAATGARVFTATSSQGLLYAMEMLFTLPGWRVPFVLVNVSRGLATPITLEPDHNDVLAARDSGFLQLHCATCQEVLDGVLVAHALAEDARVRLPAIVNLDGFHLSFTREPVAIPEGDAVGAFLPPFDAGAIRLRGSVPQAQAVAVLGGSTYSWFRYQTHLAAMQALPALEEISSRFEVCFGRRFDALDAFAMQDAEFAFVVLGSLATRVMGAVQRLRAEGWRIGVVRPRLLRPFPGEALRRQLGGLRGIAVIDQNLSMGMGGILFAEVAAALYGMSAAPRLASFVGGLGGRDIGDGELYAMARELRDGAAGNTPRLLYTRGEVDQVRQLQEIAATRTPGGSG